MKVQSLILISLIVFSVELFSNCANPDADQNINAAAPQNTNQTAENRAAESKNNAVKDNADDLGLIIKLPFNPEEALWREDNLGAPNEKKLTAVLKFTPEDSTKIVAQEQESTKTPGIETIPVETWFPAELVAQSELSGDDTLKGNVYSAGQFLQSPYSDGRLIRMENSNYFVLELFSK